MQQAHAQAHPYNNKVGHGLRIGGAWVAGLPGCPPSSASDSTSLPGQISPGWAISHGPGGPVSTEIFWRTPEDVLSFPPAPTLHSPEALPQHPRVHLLVGLESGWPWDSDAWIGEYSLFYLGTASVPTSAQIRDVLKQGFSSGEDHACRG